jgi:polyphosphate kinase 2 (PPK2 family)
MNTDTSRYRIPYDERIALEDCETRVEPLYDSKKDYRKRLKKQVKALREMQQIHYAHDRYALLLIFQAMDAAGKDGAIKHVMSGVNPQGCQVFSFKKPNESDLEHDFLWRTARCLPERGRIGIFNRSYYEEVLVVRVHPEILHGQKLPGDDISDNIASARSSSTRTTCTATARVS